MAESSTISIAQLDRPSVNMRPISTWKCLTGKEKQPAINSLCQVSWLLRTQYIFIYFRTEII